VPADLAVLLADAGLVSAEGLERARARQREAGGALDTALLELALVREGELAPLLERASGLPAAPEGLLAPDPRARRVFPARVAERHGLAPYRLEERELSVLATYPVDLAVVDEISFMLSLDLVPHVAPEWRVRELMARVYGTELPERFARVRERVEGGGAQEEAAASSSAFEISPPTSFGFDGLSAAEPSPPRPWPRERGQGSSLLRDRPFLTLLALHAPFACVFWQFMASAPLDMSRHGLSAARYGLVMATNSAVIAALQPVVVRFTPRFAPWRVLAVASLLVGLGFGGYGLASSAPGYALATGVWTLGEIAYLPTAGALVQALAPPALRGRYAGGYALAFGLGSVLAPLAGPLVLERLGSRALWGGCLALSAAVAAGFAALRPGGAARA